MGDDSGKLLFWLFGALVLVLCVAGLATYGR